MGPSGAEGGGPALEISPLEARVLRALRAVDRNALDEDELSEQLALPEDATRGTLQRLRAKQLAVSEEERREHRRLTDRGRDALVRGLPERRLLRLIEETPAGIDPATLLAQGFSVEERAAAIGRLRRAGLLLEGSPLRKTSTGPETAPAWPEERGLRSIDSEEEVEAPVFDALRKRGLATLEVEVVRHWRASAEGREVALPDEGAELLGAVTPALLAGGAWRTQGFRAYDVRSAVPYVGGARPHPVAEWYRAFEEILVGLGFQQMEGPLLETEFWNNDVLFMPQEHPARSVHDVLSPTGASGRSPPEPLGGRVARVHTDGRLEPDRPPISRGWRYPYDPSVARRPVLRSQTTAVSARFLARGPRPPFRAYALDRNFRRDALDAQHHVEFHQCEGIVGGAGVDLRDLIGIFQTLAEAIGIRELKIRPSYFPFTEPSIEGYVRHPQLGWIEVMPGGLFRPEVLAPLGIDVPVAAWGLGVGRLAMVALGLSDIRALYDDDLERLAAGGG